MKVTILDYSTGEVFIRNVPAQWQDLEGREIMEKMGFKHSTVEYMFSNSDIPLIIETESVQGHLYL